MDLLRADPLRERILILAPSGKDAVVVAAVLTRAGLWHRACATITELCVELEHGCGALLIAEEGLGDPACLVEWLGRQPPWSDLPILLAAASGSRSMRALVAMEQLGNVVLLERPFRAVTLVSAAQSALRARRRQYQMRDHLLERDYAAAELRHLNETLEQRVFERTREVEEANRRLLREAEERKQVEDALRQAQKMEAVGQLTGGVAHDFNNLLTAVLGNLEFIGMRHRDEQTQKLVLTATRAAERGAQLTQQLLAFARKQHLQPRPVNVNDIVAGMGGLLTRTIGSTIRVEQQLDPGLWPALVDPNQLELVILNLAINARDAMPVSGKLSIATANVPATSPERPPGLAGDLVRVAVSDTGSGMSEEVIARAFEPFFTTKEVGRGSGLGLSQVYGVAKQSGGDVQIRSRIGEGTVVEVYLPRARAGAPEANAAAPAAESDIPGGSETVLVVDDDRDVRELIAASLRGLGYRVLDAANGRRALEILASGEPIDCLVLDYAMPGMTGAELARIVRSRRPNLPILFTTGYADARALMEQLDDASILRKPFKIAELAERMLATLRRSRGESAHGSNVRRMRSARRE